MANLTEVSSYDAGVYQIETTDPVSGGPNGIANMPTRNLANRTNFLKLMVDAIERMAGVVVRRNWVPLTVFSVDDVALNSGTWYRCVSNHTSGATFAGDLAARWVVFQNVFIKVGSIPTWNQSTTGNAATATNVAYTGLTGTVPIWNQSTTGNAATASNVAYSGLTGTVPTWNQSTTGNAATATNVAYSGLTGTVPTWNQSTTGNAATATNAGNGVPPGAVMAFAQITAPTGWLKANGALISRATFAALFASIGTTFGAGNGSTTFGLPDMRGEFVRGWDDGRGVDSGRGFGSAQGGSNANHTHSASSGLVSNDHSHSGTTSWIGDHVHGVPDGNQNAGFGGNTFDSGGSAAIQHVDTTGAGGHNHTFSTGGISANHNHAITVNADGGEARPRNIALLHCIKF
jgi:microcystin-dependent protein